MVRFSFGFRRAALFCAALSAISLVSAGAFASPPVLVSAQTASKSTSAKMPVKTYHVIDIDLLLDQTAQNPYDSDEIMVDAVFTRTGAGKQPAQTLMVPAFWFEPFVRKTEPDGRVVMAAQTGEKAGWRVRFAPPAPGKWTMAVRTKTKDGEKTSPSKLIFTVADSKERGFVRRAEGNDRYFAFDDKTPFFMVGENVCWADKRGLAAYDDWFPKLANAGGNFARLWMAMNPIETKQTGLNHYNAANAAYFDNVLRLAQKNHLVCMMAFGTYGEFTTGGFFNEGQWPINPYNKINGGPAENPDDFWTNLTARNLYKKKLRYLAARYGAYQSLGFWEFWNEKDAPALWLHEMAAYVKSVDPYRHLVTNSAGTVARADSWRVPEMDLTQTHLYGDEGSIPDVAPLLPPDQAAHDIFNKPHILGEFGISWRNSDTKFDPNGQAINLHNGLWAGTMSGNAGGGVLWWWDSYVAPLNLYSVFAPLAAFAKTIPWTTRTFNPVYDLPAPTKAQTGAETFQDLTLVPTGSWGAKSNGAVVIKGDGSTSGPGVLLGTLLGPSKPDLRSPIVLNVDLPKPSQLIIHVTMVSESATLRVLVDGKEAASFPFNAVPGKSEGYKSTKQYPEYNNIYQAVFDVDRSAEIPQGKHTVTVENVSGDWVQIDSLKLTNAVSSRYAQVAPYVLQDSATGETLVWLQNRASTWKNAYEKKPISVLRGVTFYLPMPKNGAYQAQWWDTRTGKVRETQQAAAENGQVSLAVPFFDRDIALHLTAREPKP